MRPAAAAALVLVSLAACQAEDPQRGRAYEEMYGRPAAAQAAEASSRATETVEATVPAGQTYTAEKVASYAAAQPGPNMNPAAMRGMPTPDTAKHGWEAVGVRSAAHSTGHGAAPHAPAQEHQAAPAPSAAHSPTADSAAANADTSGH